MTYRCWARPAFEDASDAVRQAASKRLIQKLSENQIDDIDQAVEMVRTIEDIAVHEALVLRAAQARIRAASLPKIQRQGLLGDIAIKDHDADIRANALERIDQSSTLQRVANAARKKDKKLYRSAVERLNARKLDKGDAEVTESLGQQICDELRALALDSGAGRGTEEVPVQCTQKSLGCARRDGR